MNEKHQEKQYKIQCRDKIVNYYRGSFYGKPATYTLYNLAKDLSKETNEMLWYLIVAVTAMYSERKMGEKDYDDMRNSEITPDVFRLNLINQPLPDTEVPDFDEEEEKAADPSKIFKIEQLSKNKTPGTIMISTEVKLMLLKHWTLRDSLANSNYFVSKLLSWKEAGQSNLNKLIQYLGVSHTNAAQKYDYMSYTSRTCLEKNLQHISSKSPIFQEMEDINIETYVRQYDQFTSMSAFDVAYSVTALIENPFKGSDALATGNVSENINPNIKKVDNE